jgi:membrane protein YqaA with SNARE-associated domain
MSETIAVKITIAPDPCVASHEDSARARGGRLSASRKIWKQEHLGVLARLAPVAIALGCSILIIWAMFQYRDAVANLGPWRYAGVFLAELGNSAAVIIPTPGPAFTLSMAMVLNPILLGIVAGLGSTLGELAGYYLGAKGRKVIEGGRIYKWFQALAGKRVGLALFTFSLLPVPFDFTGLWAGAVRYPVLKFLGAIIVGKIVKVTVVAYAVSYGLTWLN